MGSLLSRGRVLCPGYIHVCMRTYNHAGARHRFSLLLLLLAFSAWSSAAQDMAFVEENGLVVIEAESIAPIGEWVVETTEGGYSGNGYLRWSGQNYFGDPGRGVLAYKVVINEPGDYNIRLRMSHLGAPAGDQWNDCWSRLGETGPWVKTLHPSSNQDEGFTFDTILEPSGGVFASMRYTLDAGEHTLYLSGRSTNFKMDRIHFYKDDVQDPLSTSHPESQRVESTGNNPGNDNGNGNNANPPGITLSGEQKKWHPITLTLDGPQASEDGSPNPFLDYRLEVTFSLAAHSYTVPGYFAADGNAAETGATSGNQWRVHFVPDRTGTWSYRVSMRAGSDVAISDDPNAGSPTALDGLNGSFSVSDTDKTGDDHRAKGMLRYVGEHYLRFDNGEYFIKGGADSPENFLAYQDFDGTYNQNGANYIKSYAPHVGDWRTGDPTWQSGKGKGIIGALNYLASKGMNSVYFITMNIQGDGEDVWPWTSPDERFRFDTSKLDQWNIVFNHMDYLGIMLHVLTQETENEKLLDGGALGRQRKVYFRELVARFAHHHALTWNLGEENDENSDAQRKQFASYIRALDPYDHHIVIHTYPGQYDQVYTPLLGYADFEGPSLQIFDMGISHSETLKWRERSAQNGRPWIVTIDELGPYQIGVTEDGANNNHDAVRKYTLWANLMAGGAGVEWYFGYDTASHDLNTENWRTRDAMWNFTRHALEFFQSYLPFATMQPADPLTANPNDYVFARPGSIYAIYLPEGGSADIDLLAGDYNVHWYNPRQGGGLQSGSVTTVSGGGVRSIGTPPSNPSADWAALIRSASGAMVEPTLSVSPTTLDFGSVQSGATRVLPVTITNTGNADLDLQSLEIAGDDAVLFEITNNPAPTSISPGQSRIARVVFSPGSGSADAKSALLRIRSNDDARSPMNVALQGNLNGNGGGGDPGTGGGNPNPASIKVESFTLIDASTGREIRDIEDGDVIEMGRLPSPYINIRANTEPQEVGSVQFSLNHNPNFHLENATPYAMAGDIGTTYNSWTPTPGEHTLTAKPFTSFNATGAQGIALEINFTITLDGEIPSRITLDQNFPNPFSNTTTVIVTLENASETRLIVYDVMGREVTRLIDRLMPAGTFTVTMDATDFRSGTYFYRLESNGEVTTRAMQLVK